MSRLTLRYGRAFRARFEGVPVDAVKADWARELANDADLPKTIGHALALLDLAEPPSAAGYRALCSATPALFLRASPGPRQVQRVAEVQRKYLRSAALSSLLKYLSQVVAS